MATAEELASLPPKLRAQAEEIEAQAKAAMDAAGVGPAKPPQADPEPEPAPPAAPPVEDAPKAPEITEQRPLPAHEPFGIQPERKPVASLQQAEQALRVLQGKYDSEVPRLHAQNRDLQEEVRRLKERVGKEDSSPRGESSSPKDVETLRDPKNPYGLTEDELALGDEVLGVAQKVGARIAEEAVRRAVEPLQEKLEAQDRERTQDAEGRFWADLTARVPEWERVNGQPEFVRWLQDAAPGTRRTRQSLLNEARASCDPITAAYYFERFLSETGRGSAATPDDAARTRRCPVEKPDALLEQVVPRQGAGTPVPAQRQWTMAEWTAASAEVSKMEPGNRKDKLDNELRAAWAEGRVLT